jgi:hypothetical protein
LFYEPRNNLCRSYIFVPRTTQQRSLL